ncbi:sce7726 family protein [Pleomorphomonas sp. PLEO]|uniref:sce7726 family protein n=1 Tax=Pleomorphomonas sp. PLEO TaxID=3239306 RepID=UPI00351DED77
MNTDKYYESHIKCDFLNYLRARRTIGARSVIASEYVLGATGRRADLAIYNGSRFIGIEVKSQYDTLLRLRDQINAYISCFDDVMIALDERHVEEGLEIAPVEVAVFEVGRRGDIRLRRPAAGEPQVSAKVRLQLLTMQELKKLLGYGVSAPVKRSLLLERAETLSKNAVRGAVVDAFKETFSDTSADFWRQVKGKRVTLDALGCLSRYASERVISREKENEKARFWESWQKDAAAVLREVSA